MAVAGEDPARPARVVSLNLCTDQLAMMLAGDGQLLSVSHLAYDPRSSAMAEDARGYHKNHELAEEIYLLDPGLVLAGRYSDRATVSMLKRLGIPVAVFDPAYSLDDVRARITEMGAALRQQERAAAMLRDFDTRLADLQAEVTRRPRTAIYHANGYTTGDRTLSGQILLAAGLANVASEAGLSSGGVMPLEVLALAAPEALVTGTPYPGASRSEEILDHPVVETLRHTLPGTRIADHDWLCGTPYVLRAIEDIAALRRRIEQEGQ
ncbi:ABC transporter substrate-binding protein [Thalassovita aquimarina]|uniref:ABC transporter substrate-binding protein n=1 Tax=Thalassovita aquimarina TaxID=2785917 RepID=A0ABS5HW10_9RHOB|nr:ABC transporter substrate-binding protein [Thalassovita aquimarina]MBR9653131.1 ABC transporter substrate-binding protein [Thalassovita aquimarina]